MPWSRVVEFTDPLACQAAIQSADVEILPTTKGDFEVEITQVEMHRLCIQRFIAASPAVCTVAYKADRRSIGFLTECNSSALQHCGLEVLPGDIVVGGPDVAHRRSGADFHYGSISLSIDELNAAVRAVTGSDFMTRHYQRIVHPRRQPMARLLRLHKLLGQVAHDTPEVLKLPEVVRALENETVHVMALCLSESIDVETTSGSRRHDAIVGKFEEFLAAHPRRPLYITEICEGIGVAERTLRAACEQHLGMGPIRYLTLRRMHLVRRALLGADSQNTTVTRIVTDHGFWELGRFSVAYRALFGESPSETLRRSTEDREIYLDRPLSLPTDTVAGLAH